MKTRNTIGVIALIAIIAIGIAACKDGGNDNPAPETFAVTFNANGGTPQPPTQTVTKGGKVDEPTITKANNTLDGWYTESAFTKKWIFATDTVSAEITLHAKWIPDQPKQHDSFHGVEVWSEVGVSDSQVTTIIGYLTAISGDFFPEEEVKFALLTQIRVKSGTGISKDGTVLNIGADETLLNINNYIFASVVN